MLFNAFKRIYKYTNEVHMALLNVQSCVTPVLEAWQEKKMKKKSHSNTNWSLI